MLCFQVYVVKHEIIVSALFLVLYLLFYPVAF